MSLALREASGSAPSPAAFAAAVERSGKSRSFEDVCGTLRALIAEGVLRPGDKLPPERQLSEQLGVGRYTLREALRSLEGFGLLTLRKGAKGGAFIREGNAQGVTQSFNDMVGLGSVSLDDLIEARMAVLDAAMSFACKRGTAQQLADINDNVTELEKRIQAGDGAGRQAAIERFFRLIGKASQNEALLILIESLSDTIRPFMIKAGPAPEAGVLEAHRKIAGRLQLRDVEGATLEMANHLKKLQRYLLARQRVRP